MGEGEGAGKTIAIVIAVVLVIVVLACTGIGFFLYRSTSGMVIGSGVPAKQTYEIADFTGVSNGLDADVEVTIGEGWFVEVEADDNVLPVLLVRNDNGMLVLQTDALVAPDTPMKVKVTMPVVRRLAAVGSGDIVLRAFEAQDLDVKIVGSGDIEVQGAAVELNVGVTGSGTADLDDLTTVDATVEIIGSGDALVRATGTLSAKIVGSGDIVHTGSPTVTEDVTGTGTVRKGD